MIILRHIDEETYVYYFNNSFQLVDSYENTVVTKSKSDTLETIYDVLGDYYFDIQRCSSGDEFKVGRI